jgi:hypothetical protein
MSGPRARSPSSNGTITRSRRLIIMMMHLLLLPWVTGRPLLYAKTHRLFDHLISAAK